MKKSLLILWFVIGTGFPTMAQEVLHLEQGKPAANGKVQDLAWMAGYWKGPGFGGDCEELWLPPEGDSMVGIFRFTQNGKLIFSEFMAIYEKNGQLHLKVKHFSDDFSPWEEKDKWINFRFIKTEEQTAYFSGLTVQRNGNTMTLKLAMEHNGESSIETFEYQHSDF
ncbi:DUF6265 family protein [Echinicola rosea]|uniref:DUF6265 domain-containing protein n=1 Tax=Echinicola rosea TaxID=1807691 RepID=A0ABQ1UIC4_9BACT|nr:DUF6265 family protein [Echinicola rosea]GGF19740.1 hypothetical protein GCM10011339_04670 [Echinicola rosea]